jgi:hypothetical protein
MDAQLRVAPLALYMSDRSPAGRIIVENISSEPRHVMINLRFGYPSTNLQGNVVMVYKDSAEATDPSAAQWIRVYPRQILLQPGEQQTFRFMARVPASLPDGEYWVRPVVTSNPLVNYSPDSKLAIRTKNSQSISMQFNVTYETVISINFRRGKVQTGVQLNFAEGQIVNDRFQFMIDVQRKGNAAFVGNIVCHLLDENNNELFAVKRELAVYYAMKRKYEFEVPTILQKRTHFIGVELNTDRQGNHAGDILQILPVSGTYPLRTQSRGTPTTKP